MWVRRIFINIGNLINIIYLECLMYISYFEYDDMVVGKFYNNEKMVVYFVIFEFVMLLGVG